MDKQLHTAQGKFEIKAADPKGEFSGYASVFEIEDADGEAIASGAFAASLAGHQANGTSPALLWQHQVQEPIGKWLELKEDDTGLRAKGKLFVEAIRRAAEAFVLLKEKAITGLSIGFIPKKWEFDEDSLLLTFTEVELLEVSVVTLPANPRARVGEVKRHGRRARYVFSRACEDLSSERSFERFLREAGFPRTRAEAITRNGFTARGDPGPRGGDASQGDPGSVDQGDPDRGRRVTTFDTELRRYFHDERSTLGGQAPGRGDQGHLRTIQAGQ